MGNIHDMVRTDIDHVTQDVPNGLTVEILMQLLGDVVDPALSTKKAVQEQADYNRKIYKMISTNGFIPAIRQQLEPMRPKEWDEEAGYCVECFLLDRFLTDDPDISVVGVD